MARDIRFPVDEPNTLSFTLEGEVDIQVDVTETSDGDLEFTLTVLGSGDNIGDLRGFFFDFGDSDLVDGLNVSGDDVTGSKFSPGKVANLGKGNNMKGMKSDDGSDFDGGVAFGKQGIGHDDDIQQTTFTLSHPDFDLSLDDLADVDFGLRLTSVGEEDGARNGSLKHVGTIPDHEHPEDPDEPQDPDDPQEPEDPQDPEDPQEPEDPQDPDEPQEPDGPNGPPQFESFDEKNAGGSGARGDDDKGEREHLRAEQLAEMLTGSDAGDAEVEAEAEPTTMADMPDVDF